MIFKKNCTCEIIGINIVGIVSGPQALISQLFHLTRFSQFGCFNVNNSSMSFSYTVEPINKDA